MDERLEVMRRCFQPRQWFKCDGDIDPYIINEQESFMWVYRKNQEGQFEVGYFAPDGAWFAEGVFASKEEAVLRVHYLNGGK